MKKILLTGVAGFIGSNLAHKLLADNKIIGIDNLNEYYDVNIKKNRIKQLKHKNFIFIKGNIADKELLEEVFNKYKIDTVINLAAQAGVRYSVYNPDVYIESNIIGFYNILECCRKWKINHLIYASSSSVYGEHNNIPFDVESNTDKPVSLYAATKKSNEILAYSYSKLYNIKCTGLRFFTIYGPDGRPDMAYYEFTKKIINGEVIKLYNYGKCERDFTYINDAIECIIRILKKPVTKIYNIGRGNPIKIEELLKIIKKELINQNLIPENYQVKIEFLPEQKGDTLITYSNNLELVKDLNYKPETKIETGIHNFIVWYKENMIKK